MEAEHVAVRVQEPRRLLGAEHAHLVDGLEVRQVVVLEDGATALQLGDRGADVLDLEADRGVLPLALPAPRIIRPSIPPPASSNSRLPSVFVPW